MWYRARPILLVLLSCFILLQVARGQGTASELRLRALERQVERDEARLSEAREAERSSLETLQDLERDIALREELSRSYRERMRQIALQTDSLRNSMSGLYQQVSELKQEYRRRAIHAYKYGRLHDVALILAASSINEMLVRARYLSRFAEQRRRKLKEIEQAAVLLRTRQSELDSIRIQNAALLRDADDQERSLTQLKSDRQRVLSGLRQQRSILEAELRRSQAAASELQLRVRRSTEVETQRTRSAPDPGRATDLAKLTGSFRQNRGRLPWPVTGAVIEPFGTRVNPTYGTTTSNPGILISAPPADPVRAVFSGEVIMVDVMPEYGSIVTVSHGEFKSVYSNFSSVVVRSGDRVQAGQVLGRAGQAGSPKGEAVFFALFQNGKPVDPLPWLQGR